MRRRIQYTTHLPLPFDEVCLRIDDRCGELLSGATASAAFHLERFASRGELAGFEPTEPVTIATASLERKGLDVAELALLWDASSPERRLLPHVDARLLVNGVILKGPHASTALSVVGSFDPTQRLRQRLSNQTFSRRVVDEAIAAFVRSMATMVLDEPIDLREASSRPAHRSSA